MEKESTTTSRKIVWLVVVSLLTAAWIVGVDRVWPADGATPKRACVTISGDPCPTPDGQVKKFKARKLQNSSQVRLTPKLREMARDYVRAHPGSARQAPLLRDGGHWWDWPFETTMCMMHGGKGTMTNCDTKAETGRKIASGGTWLYDVSKRTTKLTVTCGGAAVIGTLGGGGYWGAGRGAAVCLWIKAIGQMW